MWRTSTFSLDYVTSHDSFPMTRLSHVAVYRPVSTSISSARINEILVCSVIPLPMSDVFSSFRSHKFPCGSLSSKGCCIGTQTFVLRFVIEAPFDSSGLVTIHDKTI
jgi:hypothetical protein